MSSKEQAVWEAAVDDASLVLNSLEYFLTTRIKAVDKDMELARVLTHGDPHASILALQAKKEGLADLLDFISIK